MFIELLVTVFDFKGRDIFNQLFLTLSDYIAVFIWTCLFPDIDLSVL